MKTVAAFDFLSHEFMHLPFNEGYLRVLRAAFTDEEIIFLASNKHLKNIRCKFSPDDHILFRPIEPFGLPSGRSPHNPIWGRPAARRCWAQLTDALLGKKLTFTAILGEDANLLAVIRQEWSRKYASTLHFILHNHLSASRRWRSRNPIFRSYDFASELRRGLPEGQKLVTLELGIAAAVHELFPVLEGALVTLEHPILESEWAMVRERTGEKALQVGFLGHCSEGKGFRYFLELANRHTGERVEFHAIGLRSRDFSDGDLAILKRKPSTVSVPRHEYLTSLAAMDLICLPLPSTYDYVASGSVIDAIAAAKPLALVRNRPFGALIDTYGPIGPMMDDRQGLEDFFSSVTLETFEQDRPTWVESLQRIRAARRPDAMAQGYRAAISG
jgi:hypothetical protein